MDLALSGHAASPFLENGVHIQSVRGLQVDGIPAPDGKKHPAAQRSIHQFAENHLADVRPLEILATNRPIMGAYATHQAQ
jgi:hypothetical protein